MQKIPLATEADTLALGAQLAPVLKAGDVIALTGGLGAGKTSLARGLIQSVLGPCEVPSPTYTLVQCYELPAYELWHCDMYRLKQPEDGYELGLIDAFEEAVCLIEWPDKLGDFMPETALSIHIEFEGEGRSAHLRGFGDRLG